MYFLGRDYLNGYVKSKFKAKRRILKEKIRVLNDTIKAFEQSRIAKGKLINITNKILKKIFGPDAIGALPKDILPGEAEIAAENVREQLLAQLRVYETVAVLIDNCESGINPKTNKGQSINAVVEPIAMATSREIYGGFVIYSSKLKVEFATKPGGYNVCLKLAFPDGSVGRFYSGFGDDFICRTGTGKFEGISQSDCNKVIPQQQVGYVIQKRIYNFTSLPDRTTQELVDQMRIEVMQDRPIVGVLAFTTNISRDAAIKACDSF